jgi:hypothetical protein
MSNNPNEDIISEVVSLMKEAYNNGVNDGIERQRTTNAKLEDPRIILTDFIKHVKQHRLSYVDGERRFSDENFAYTDESFIKTFLLKYDYYAQD